MSVDVPLLVGLLAFCYFQFSNLTSREIRQRYEEKKEILFIPGWVFGIVWPVLYGLIVVSAYFAFETPEEHANFLATLILFIINMFLNKYWTVVFFDMQRVGMALFIALALLGTSITVVALMGRDQLMLSVGLYVPYCAWLVVACILNWQWYRSENKATDLPQVQLARNIVPPAAPSRSVRFKVPPKGFVRHV